MADCGLRRFGALPSIGRIVDCTWAPRDVKIPEKRNIASSVRSLNCAGPGSASNLAPEALDVCILR
eukprot:15439443-Alexandrium_andersonii.AAC.1